MKTEKAGSDLIVTFDAKGNGITEEEFAPKLIGKTTSGKLLYGYARLAYVSYNNPILSARIPAFTASEKGFDLSAEVQNFGQVASKTTTLHLEYKKNGQTIKVGSSKVPALDPYQKTTVQLSCDKLFEKGISYDFILSILIPGEKPSIFNFSTVPVK